MKATDIAAGMLVAAGALAATLVAFWPVSLGAETGKAPPRPVAAIREPMLKVSGCEVQARVISGEANCPELVLTARNPTDKPVHFDVTAIMMSQPPASPMMRMMPVPRQVWKESIPVSLVPGETRAIAVKPGRKVAGGLVLFRLQSGSSFITVRAGVLAPPKSKAAAVKLALPGAAQAGKAGQ